ncbi:hypothetical protein M885DRAFT_505682 [Pelagophyceae sp. CCMP2097]|nr:hypothetical protein M885DRAFT_505682 [Pelagophyceae sp. CCMP2097]
MRGAGQRALAPAAQRSDAPDAAARGDGDGAPAAMPRGWAAAPRAGEILDPTKTAATDARARGIGVPGRVDGWAAPPQRDRRAEHDAAKGAELRPSTARNAAQQLLGRGAGDASPHRPTSAPSGTGDSPQREMHGARRAREVLAAAKLTSAAFEREAYAVSKSGIHFKDAASTGRADADRTSGGHSEDRRGADAAMHAGASDDGGARRSLYSEYSDDDDPPPRESPRPAPTLTGESGVEAALRRAAARRAAMAQPIVDAANSEDGAKQRGRRAADEALPKAAREASKPKAAPVGKTASERAAMAEARRRADLEFGGSSSSDDERKTTVPEARADVPRAEVPKARENAQKARADAPAPRPAAATTKSDVTPVAARLAAAARKPAAPKHAAAPLQMGGDAGRADTRREAGPYESTEVVDLGARRPKRVEAAAPPVEPVEPSTQPDARRRATDLELCDVEALEYGRGAATLSGGGGGPPRVVAEKARRGVDAGAGAEARVVRAGVAPEGGVARSGAAQTGAAAAPTPRRTAGRAADTASEFAGGASELAGTAALESGSADAPRTVPRDASRAAHDVEAFSGDAADGGTRSAGDGGPARDDDAGRRRAARAAELRKQQEAEKVAVAEEMATFIGKNEAYIARRTAEAQAAAAARKLEEARARQAVADRLAAEADAADAAARVKEAHDRVARADRKTEAAAARLAQEEAMAAAAAEKRRADDAAAAVALEARLTAEARAAADSDARASAAAAALADAERRAKAMRQRARDAAAALAAHEAAAAGAAVKRRLGEAADREADRRRLEAEAEAAAASEEAWRAAEADAARLRAAAELDAARSRAAAAADAARFETAAAARRREDDEAGARALERRASAEAGAFEAARRHEAAIAAERLALRGDVDSREAERKRLMMEKIDLEALRLAALADDDAALADARRKAEAKHAAALVGARAQRALEARRLDALRRAEVARLADVALKRAQDETAAEAAAQRRRDELAELEERLAAANAAADQHRADHATSAAPASASSDVLQRSFDDENDVVQRSFDEERQAFARRVAEAERIAAEAVARAAAAEALAAAPGLHASASDFAREAALREAAHAATLEASRRALEAATLAAHEALADQQWQVEASRRAAEEAQSQVEQAERRCLEAEARAQIAENPPVLDHVLDVVDNAVCSTPLATPVCFPARPVVADVAQVDVCRTPSGAQSPASHFGPLIQDEPRSVPSAAESEALRRRRREYRNRQKTCCRRWSRKCARCCAPLTRVVFGAKYVAWRAWRRATRGCRRRKESDELWLEWFLDLPLSRENRDTLHGIRKRINRLGYVVPPPPCPSASYFVANLLLSRRDSPCETVQSRPCQGAGSTQAHRRPGAALRPGPAGAARAAHVGPRPRLASATRTVNENEKSREAGRCQSWASYACSRVFSSRVQSA